MKRIDADTFVITTSASGRTYVVHRRNRSKMRALGRVQRRRGALRHLRDAAGGAQLGADALTGRRPRAAPLDAASARGPGVCARSWGGHSSSRARGRHSTLYKVLL